MLIGNPLLALLAVASSAVAVPTSSSSTGTSSSSSSSSCAPVVDLGKYGKYKGVVQNNGTVHSWKAIPYAAPPVGDLRFKAPRALAKQNSTVQDVSADFPGHPTACIQFGTTSFVGVNAGPGQEDCLKLWIWAPAGAKAGDKLPVQVYTHGGGLQNSQSPNNDFSDWVGQSANFIAVNANYRLGLLGNFNSKGSIWEGESANVGILDGRFAVDWVKANIAKFGGDPENIAIAGQSGGGGAVMTQLVLYDGKKPNYQKAIARSPQSYSAYTVDELTTRNDAFSSYVNCTDSAATKDGAKKQLACLRALPAETIRLAALDFAMTTQSNGLSWQGWLPSVDGKTLTDVPNRLFAAGKSAKVDVLAGCPTNDFAGLNPSPNANFSALVTSTTGGVSASLLSSLERIYPEPIVNASTNTNTYLTAQERSWTFLNDYSFKSVTVAIAKAALGHGKKAFLFRFDAPNLWPHYPGFYSAAHSADNSYLQNATSTQNSTEKAVALEWRAYVSSFLTHSDPSTSRLPTSPLWLSTSSTFRYLPRLVLQQQLASSANLSVATSTAMELVPSNEWDRLNLFLSGEVTAETRQ